MLPLLTDVNLVQSPSFQPRLSPWLPSWCPFICPHPPCAVFLSQEATIILPKFKTDHVIALLKTIPKLLTSFQIKAKCITQANSSHVVCPLTILLKIISYYSPKWIFLHFLEHSRRASAWGFFPSLRLVPQIFFFGTSTDFAPLTPFTSLIMLFMTDILNYNNILNCLISSMHLSLSDSNNFFYCLLTGM